MDFDVIIIGAGVVGLACARESARRGLKTLVVERHASFGQETSSRNSEVVHSGVYYPVGSLKARLCVAANRTLYDECERMNVWHRRCGKLIVAVTPEEEPELEKLKQRGKENGVEEIHLLTRAQVAEMEPSIQCCSALHIPSTGIVDSHELMKAYLYEARSNGAEVIFHVQYEGMEKLNDGYRITFHEAYGEITQLETRVVINAGGLHADSIAQTFGIDIDAAGYRLYPNRGHYFAVSATKSKAVSRLIYPVPEKHIVGAGIHMTIDKAGRCRLGPDAEFLKGNSSETEWYKFDESRKEKFFQAVVRYFPILTVDDLSPDQVGVRPKLAGSEKGVKDFIIREETDRGLPGVVNLVGIESPGLTCSTQIAQEAFRQLSV